MLGGSIIVASNIVNMAKVGNINALSLLSTYGGLVISDIGMKQYIEEAEKERKSL